MADSYPLSNSVISPIVGGFSITPSDGSDLEQVTRQIRVTGASGNISVVWHNGSESIEPVLTGETLDWRIARVKATGTTATGLRGYY